MRLTYTLPVVGLHKINVLVCFAAPLNTWQAFDLRPNVHEYSDAGRAARANFDALASGGVNAQLVLTVGMGDMAKNIFITIMFIISVDIDNYHDKCQILISFKWIQIFFSKVKVVETRPLTFLNTINIQIEKQTLVSACSKEWYCFKSGNKFGLPHNINNNFLELHIW